MALTPDQISVLGSIRKEWNQAEKEIKLAEQVCMEIVVPAIKELRYAGRRLVDLIEAVITNPDAPEISDFLADAQFDCYRARHDAIDAATSKIAIQLEIMEEKIGYEIIFAVAPEFKEVAKSVADVREKISISRGNRKDRQKIYESVSVTDFPKLVKAYVGLKNSEEIMKKVARGSRRRDFFGKWGFWVGTVGLAVGALALWFAVHPPHALKSAAASHPLQLHAAKK